MVNYSNSEMLHAIITFPNVYVEFNEGKYDMLVLPNGLKIIFNVYTFMKYEDTKKTLKALLEKDNTIAAGLLITLTDEDGDDDGEISRTFDKKPILCLRYNYCDNEKREQRMLYVVNKAIQIALGGEDEVL